METKIQSIVVALKLIDAITQNNYYDKQTLLDGTLIDMMELRDIFAIMVDSEISYWKGPKHEILMLQDTEDIRAIVIKISGIEKPMLFKYEPITEEEILKEVIKEENYEAAAFLRDLENTIIVEEITVEESKNYL